MTSTTLFPRRPRVRRHRGFTMAELIVAIGLSLILMVLVVTGMTLYAKSVRSITMQARISESARAFMEKLYSEASDADSITAPTATSLVITQTVTLADLTRATKTITYEFFSKDNETATPTKPTISDNRIQRTEVFNGATKVEANELTLCARVPTVAGNGFLPVFEDIDYGAPHDPPTETRMTNVLLRVGDSWNPPINKSGQGNFNDDVMTGRGFQSFLIKASLVIPPKINVNSQSY